MKNKDH